MKRIYIILTYIFITHTLFSQSFTEQTDIVLPGISNGSVAWGDYDNDDNLDILLSGFKSDNYIIVKIFRNDGTNTFSEQDIFSPAIPASYAISNSEAHWADFDNDGFIDIIINCPSPSGGKEILIYRNEGNGNNAFTLKLDLNYMTWDKNSVDCGDYDNDGDPDFIVTSNMQSKIYKNLGNFIFSEQSSISLGITYNDMTIWGDYDNDGDLDILFPNAAGYSAAIYQNQGNNQFTLQSGINFSYRGETADWGDYDNDGFLDILMTGSGDSRIFQNTGNSNFNQQFDISLEAIRDGMGKWGDLDNDGDLDIILCGNNNNTYVTSIYLNEGGNVFSKQEDIILEGIYQSSLALGDYDNDNDLDVLIAGNKGTSKICKVYRNESTTTNPVPAGPDGLESVIAGKDVILKWNPVPGDNTPGVSLSYNVMTGTTSDGFNIVAPNASWTGLRRISKPGNGQLDTTFILKNLRKGTYYWKVQAIDNSFSGSVFSTEASFIYSESFQAYGLNVTNPGGVSATLNWSRGNGDNCIVFMKEGNEGFALPVNNTSYTGSSVFSSGSEIPGSGWYCVYNGSDNSVEITGLNANTEYLFQVIEFEGGPGSESYYTETLTDNPLAFKTGIFTEVTTSTLQPVTKLQLSSVQISNSFWIDIDNDDDLDIFLIGDGGSNYLYQNEGGKNFVLLSSSFDRGYSAACGDYNNDDFVDIVINNGDNIKIYKNNRNSTFTDQSGISLPGGHYGSVDLGDFDNDGDLDIIATGQSYTLGTNISNIYTNNGDNTFTEQTNISLPGLRMGCSRWGDYDNDGFLDILLSGITVESSSLTRIFRNNRNGNFIAQSDITLSNCTSGDLEWGDYDNDGNLDIMIISSSGSRVYRNEGNNAFIYQNQISLSKALYSSGAWGDYNNDGYLDICLSGYTGMYIPVTELYLNNSDNTFSLDTLNNITGAGSSSVSWGDLNNDGDLDLLVTGSSQTEAFSRIYRNDITSGNTPPDAPGNPVSVVNKSDVELKWNSVRTDITGYKTMSYNIRVGTVGQGIDIVSPHSSPDGYRRVVNIGNCNFDTTFYFKDIPFGKYYWSVQAVDNGFSGGPFSNEDFFSVVPVQANNLSAKIVNNNGLLLKWERGNGDRCVVFCKETSSGSSSPANYKSYLPDSEFGYGEQIGSTNWYCVYNGRYDSVVVSGLTFGKEYSFHVIEYLGEIGSEEYFPELADGNPGVFSTGLFAEQAGISLSSANHSSVAWGDYDNDGFADLLIPGSPSRIFHNNGDNTFTELAGTSLASITFGAASWGDYDNDNKLDIILTGTAGGFPDYTPHYTKIYRNLGSGVFTEQTQIALESVYYSSVDWGDYNNDGFLDILLTGARGSDPNYDAFSCVYMNNGNRTFSYQDQINLTGVFKSATAWVDYDNDGDLDIYLSGATDYQYDTNKVSELYKNNGDNTFTKQTQIQIEGLWEASADWGDYDNDGDMDIVMAMPGKLFVYQNQDNNFIKQLDLGFGYNFGGTAKWGDYDNDGYLDLLFSNHGAASQIYRNINGESFSLIDDESFKITWAEYLAWCDYDNDGDMDLLVSIYGDKCKIYKNNLIMKSGKFNPNIPPAAPDDLKTSHSPAGVTLSWNGINYDETYYETMSYNVLIGTMPDSSDICPPHADTTGLRRISSIGNAQLDTTYLLKNITSGKYYWKVQAVDQGFVGGEWSALDSFILKNTQAFFISDTVCQDNPTHFTDQSVATDGIALWNWDFNDGTTADVQNPEHTFDSGGNHLVKLVITSNEGDQDSLEQTVIVKPKPLVDFSASLACQGTETNLTNLTNSNGVIITSWSWDYGDGKGSVSEDPGSHGYLSAGDYQLSLYVEADNGCGGSTQKTVTVGAYPVAAITANAPLNFCAGDSVVLAVESNPDYLYRWLLNGFGITDAQSPEFKAKASGNYSVEVTNTKGNCQVTSSPVAITSLEMPASPEIITNNYIPGQCMSDNAITLSVDQPAAGYNYQWKRNGALINDAKLSHLEGYLPAGDYSVVAGLSGCTTESEVQTVYYDEAPEKPLIYAEGPAVWYLACSNDSAAQYKWYYNGTEIPGANTYLYVANQNLGDYYVSIANAKGCFTSSDIKKIPPDAIGIHDADVFTGLEIYPNPTPGMFVIEMNNQVFGQVVIKIFDQGGKEVLNLKKEKETVDFTVQINLVNQNTGSYLVKLEIGKKIAVRKLIVNY